MGHQQLLQGKNYSPQIRLVFVVVKLPLSVKDIVHGHHVVLIEQTDLSSDDTMMLAALRLQSLQILQAVPPLQLAVSKLNYQTCTEQQDRTQHFEPYLNKQEVIDTFSPSTPDRTLLNSCI